MRFYVVLILLALIPLSCKESPPGPRVPTTFLSVEDVSCTEAWLKVSIPSVNSSRTIVIERNGKTFLLAQLASTDSVFIDDSLAPNHTYIYQAKRLQGSVVLETTPALEATTMDTTSHDFTWEIDTIGGAASSVLYDVAIINDTLVYAVGEVYLKDSTGQIDPLPYNLAVWDGRRWNMTKLNYQGYPPVIRFVFALNESNIWFDTWFRWDGQHFLELPIDPVFIGIGWNKMCGSSGGDLYVAGNAGTIAYSPDRGTTWQKLMSGTTSDIRDVWGYGDPSAGRTTILSVASSPTDTRILSLSPKGVQDVLSWPEEEALRGIWMGSHGVVYVSGSGVWRHTSLGWRQAPGLPNVFFTGVRGTAENNVFAVSWGGVLAHFNGVTWHLYTEIPAVMSFETVAASVNTVVAAGFTGGLFVDKAAIIVGRRTQ